MPDISTGAHPEWVKKFIHYEDLIKEALEHSHGTYNIADVFDSIMNGDSQFWPGKNSVAITQIVQYPRKKILHCFLAAGDIEEIALMEEDAVLWAKSQGCSALTLTGRAGWAKSFLKNKGYTCSQVQMTKEF
jgi:hypothetical protein